MHELGRAAFGTNDLPAEPYIDPLSERAYRRNGSPAVLLARESIEVAAADGALANAALVLQASCVSMSQTVDFAPPIQLQTPIPSRSKGRSSASRHCEEPLAEGDKVDGGHRHFILIGICLTTVRS